MDVCHGCDASTPNLMNTCTCFVACLCTAIMRTPKKNVHMHVCLCMHACVRSEEWACHVCDTDDPPVEKCIHHRCYLRLHGLCNPLRYPLVLDIFHRVKKLPEGEILHGHARDHAHSPPGLHAPHAEVGII
jgi:hypothetical protein